MASIFVSIDDNEEHHLRCLLDEVFGEHNFVSVRSSGTAPPTTIRRTSQPSTSTSSDYARQQTVI